MRYDGKWKMEERPPVDAGKPQFKLKTAGKNELYIKNIRSPSMSDKMETAAAKDG